MLPASTYVGGVSLQVSDLERSLGFYRDLLGFDVREEAPRDGRRAARLAVPGTTTELVELLEKPGVRRVPPRGLIGLYHFAILLPSRGDLGRFFRHAALARVHVGAADHLVSEALYLTDPDGITVEIYRDRSPETWPRRHDELVMASDPIDADGLIEAAGSEPWRSMPEATRMGHMHFYVGDLNRAREFYVDGLGFNVTSRSYPGALFVAAGGYHHHVGLNTWAAGAPVATDDDARLVHWDLVVPDGQAVSLAATRLAARGYSSDTTGAALTARDPWGSVVRVRTPGVE